MSAQSEAVTSRKTHDASRSEFAAGERSSLAFGRRDIICLWFIALLALVSITPDGPAMPDTYLQMLLVVSSALFLLEVNRAGEQAASVGYVRGGVFVALLAAVPLQIAWPAIHGAGGEGPIFFPSLLVCLVSAANAWAIDRVMRSSAYQRLRGRKGRSISLRQADTVVVIVVVSASVAMAVMVLGGLTGGSDAIDAWGLAGRSLSVAALAGLVVQLAAGLGGTLWVRSYRRLAAAGALALGIVGGAEFMESAGSGVPSLILFAAACLVLALPFPSWRSLLGLIGVLASVPGLLELLDLSYSDSSGTSARVLPLAFAAVVASLAVLVERANAAFDVLQQDRRVREMRAWLGQHGGGRLLRADIGRREVHLLDASEGHYKRLPFSVFFANSDGPGLLKLLDALKGDAPLTLHHPFSLPLQPDPFAIDRQAGASEARPHDVFILGREGAVAWLGIVNTMSDAGLKARAERAEAALGEALMREERFLSVASHELRTPMSILSMLAEELDDGAPWDDVALSFKKASGRVIQILDDLRVQDSNEQFQIRQTEFTLRELAFHLQETFTGPAQANGMALILALSQQSDILIQSDYGRVFIALSKLIHNAIIHSRGTEITLSAFLTRQSGGSVIVTWQVSDDGRGVSPERYETVFRPFDTDGRSEGGGRPGLGLYTAQKAARGMGGDIYLRQTNNGEIVPRRLPAFASAAKKDNTDEPAFKPGATFVLKHPARISKPSDHSTMEHDPVTESKATYQDKTVLLVEDNQIVGDITVSRMKRLFGKSLWAECVEDALEAYDTHQPDMLLVDQLLPNVLGSEFIKQIRETRKSIPIIGITASTMGSECTDLEAAGANYALEKPLSFKQLQKIALEFFGEPDAAGPDDTDT